MIRKGGDWERSKKLAVDRSLVLSKHLVMLSMLRCMLKFCINLGKMGKEAHDLIRNAYVDAAMGGSCVFERCKLFQEVRERVEDERSAGSS